MKKYIKMFAGLAICVLTLAGCSGEVVPKLEDSDVISVDKEGVITSYLISDFDKEYYDTAELTNMAVKDAAAYNEEHQVGEAVPLTVQSVEMKGTNVVLQHRYSDAEAYSGYNQKEFFYGTVSEALDEGYDLTALLTSVKDGQPLSQEDLMKKPEKTYVLITDAKADIYCARKITHVGDGVAYNEDGSVDTSLVEGVVVILMK